MLYIFPFCIYVFLAPCQGVAVEVTTYYPALWRRLDVLQVYLFVGWAVDKQALPSENESNTYMFCVTVLGSGYFYRRYFVSDKNGDTSFGSIFLSFLYTSCSLMWNLKELIRCVSWMQQSSMLFF